MRRTAWIAAAAVLVGMLVPASAQAAPAPSGPVAPYAAATGLSTMAARYAPHLPGVSRYDGRIPASVRQVIVVRATRWSSTTGSVSLYRRSGAGWMRIATWWAQLGYGGLVVGTQRRQGTGTTPAGAYPITMAFGRQADPGTALPYTKVTRDHWWVEDRRSAYYNEMRLGRLGGFALRTSGYNSSEHLAFMGPQYDYAAVVDFNRPDPVIGRGAGIFLHAFGSGATAGCIAIRVDRIRATLRWLSPAQHPWIVIGPTSWLDA